MSVIDEAIQRIQDLVTSCTSVTIKTAPDYPPEDASVLPMSVTHIGGGTAIPVGGVGQFQINIFCDVFLANVNLKDTYTKIDNLVPDFVLKLIGDPTLNGKVTTVNYPISIASPTGINYNGVATMMVRFTIPCKFMLT